MAADDDYQARVDGEHYGRLYDDFAGRYLALHRLALAVLDRCVWLDPAEHRAAQADEYLHDDKLLVP